MFNKERKERCRLREKKLSKNDIKNKKKHAQEQNKAKKGKQKHTRVRAVELRGKVVFTS